MKCTQAGWKALGRKAKDPKCKLFDPPVTMLLK